MSESTKVILLFDLTMSYVMAMKDTPMKWKVREIFNEFEKVGTALWDVVIKQLKKDGHEASFDAQIIEMNELFRLYTESTDRPTLLALMAAFNRGEVVVKNEE